MAYAPIQIGERIGLLTAVEFVGMSGNHRLLKFGCECGGQKTTRAAYVRAGYVKSCGCRYRETRPNRRLPEGEAQRRHAFDRSRRGAEKRGLEFSLSREEFDFISAQPCHYCGSEPVFKKQKTYASGASLTGVDREDNTKGYVSGNVVPCCWTCNAAKGTMTVAEFKNWSKQLFSNFGGKP